MADKTPSWDDVDKETFGNGNSGEWNVSADQPKQDSHQAWEKIDNDLKSPKSAKAFVKAADDSNVVQPAKLSDFEGQTLKVGPVDTHIPLPASVTRGLAQIGSGFADTGLGYRQVFGGATKAEADEKKRIDAALNTGVSGAVNNFTGKIAPFLAVPQGVAPTTMRGFGTVLEGMAQGAGQAALEPVGTGDNRGQNIAVGGVAGGIFPAMGSLARGAVRMDPLRSRLVASADQEGIPLSTADVTQNRIVKAFRDIGNDLPITGSRNAGIRERQQSAFNQAVGSRWGSTADSHTPNVRAADKARIGAAMNDVYSRNDLPYDNQLAANLFNIRQRASMFPADVQHTVNSHLDDIENHMAPDGSGGWMIPGPAFHNLQSDLNSKFGQKLDPSQTDTLMSDARGMLLDHYNGSLTGADAEQMNTARQQYRAFKTVDNAMKRADTGMAGKIEGDINPIALSKGVMDGYPRDPSASPFGDLPQIGQHFIRDKVGQTGGSPKAFVQNNATAAAGIAALGGAGWLGGPLTALGGASAMVGANEILNSPAIRRMVQNSGQMRQLLDNPDTAAAALETLKKLAAVSAPAGALGFVDSVSAKPRIEISGTDRDVLPSDSE